MVERRVQEGLHTSQAAAEDSINVELLDWLKKNWSTLVLVVALAVLLFQGTQWWKQRTEDRLSIAWADLENTQTVPGLLDVADQHRSVGSISELAWLRAAEMHYEQLLRDEPVEDDLAIDSTTDESVADTDADADAESTSDVSETDNVDEGTNEAEAATDEAVADTDADAEPAADPKPTGLSEADRAELLDKMESMYQRVLDSSSNDPTKELFAIRAAFGMAMVSEMRREFEAADSWYERIEGLSRDHYAKLGRIAAARRQNMRDESNPISILPREEIDALEKARDVPELLARPEFDPNEEGDADDADPESAGDATGESDSEDDDPELDIVTDEPTPSDNEDDGGGG
jgi:hypothetical protein